MTTLQDGHYEGTVTLRNGYFEETTTLRWRSLTTLDVGQGYTVAFAFKKAHQKCKQWSEEKLRVVYHLACEFAYHISDLCAPIRRSTLLSTRGWLFYRRLRLDGSFP